MIQIRGDIEDINGFEWMKTQVKMPDINNISANWVGVVMVEFSRVLLQNQPQDEKKAIKDKKGHNLNDSFESV